MAKGQIGGKEKVSLEILQFVEKYQSCFGLDIETGDNIFYLILNKLKSYGQRSNRRKRKY